MMHSRLIGLGFALATWVVPAGAQSQAPAVVLDQPIRHTGATLELNLRAADAATVTHTLGEVLGGGVRIEGAAPAPVTIERQGISARAALDAVATALHGNWRPVYTVARGAAPAGARRPSPLGRTVTASLETVSARAALALVARAGGGSLEVPVDVPGTVSLVAKEMPVEQALDELARQLDAAWSVTYVIRAGTVPPPAAAPQPASTQQRLSPDPVFRQLAPTRGGARRQNTGLLRPGENPQAGRADDRASFPAPSEVQPQPAAPVQDPNAARLLAEGLTRIMHMPPAQRRNAVKDLAAQLDQQFRQLQSLPGPRRAEQMTAMRPLFQAATRAYSGFTPDQRGEFQPVMDVFNRWMR